MRKLDLSRVRIDRLIPPHTRCWIFPGGNDVGFCHIDEFVVVEGNPRPRLVNFIGWPLPKYAAIVLNTPIQCSHLKPKIDSLEKWGLWSISTGIMES